MALALPGAAQAQVGHIAGNPLDVYADGAGRLQFRFTGQTDGVFYSPESNSADAGLEIREGGVHYGLGAATPVEGPTLQTLGAGTRGLHSVYTVGPHLRVTEDVTYTDQTSSVGLRYAITNVSGATVSVSAAELADLYAAGSDRGVGVLDPGPPRFVGGRSANGALTGLVEETPWSHYQSGNYAEVFRNFAGEDLSDKIDATDQDNGVGAQWDFTVAPGATQVITVTWRLGAATQTVRVNTTDDHADGECTAADCTLRDAIAFAPQGTVIEIPAGTYALNPQGGELRLGGVTLRGAGAGATILTGAGQSRVLTTNFGGQAFVSRLTITGGNGQGESLSGYGGAIYVDSDSALTLTDVAVTDNRARGEGGGIYSDGRLKVERSVIARNESAPVEAIATGGGLALRNGSAELTNTTVSGNTASRGAGIFSGESVTLDLRNATIAANHAGAGLYVSPPTAAARANDQVTALNTLIAGNQGGACDGDTPGQSSHTLTDDASCALAGSGDRQNADARLEPLSGAGTHALGAGSQAIDAADAGLCPLSDQLGTPRPQGPACDIGAYERPVAAPPEEEEEETPAPEVTPAPPQPLPQPLPQLQDPLPPPVVGKSVNAAPKSGTVKIKLPGSNRFIELDGAQQIPVGTTVDTRKGRITLTSAADSKGATQTADFYQGLFRISQTRGSKPITTLALVEKLTGCPRAKRASASAKKPKSRKLWGSGKGRFRTTGQYSSATVRGTVWLTQDRCDRTVTKVTQGTVAVRDNVKRKTVVIRAGRSYTARAKRR